MLSASSVFRFGVFEVDLRTEELRKHGMKLRLPRQSFAVLAMLLERPGELVSRDELREKLWPADTFVDFDHGLNAAVNRLREALGDSADLPRFIETLPRRGYRFIASVEAPPAQPGTANSGDGVAPQAAKESITDTMGFEDRSGRRFAPTTKWILVSAGILLMAAITYWGWHHPATTSNEPITHADVTVVPFTTYKGEEVSPGFSPDGNSIVFAWDGGNSDAKNRFDLYVKQVGSESLLRLTSKPSVWLVPAWSPDGRTIAFRRRSDTDGGIFTVPSIGGPERKLADDQPGLLSAGTLSWSPDGRELAYSNLGSSSSTTIRVLSVETGAVRQIPTPGCDVPDAPIFSPDRKWLAFGCRPHDDNGVSGIFIMPRDGGTAKQVIAMPGIAPRLAWSHDARRIIFPTVRADYLWEVSIDDGKKNALFFAREADQPAVAPSGNRLAYAYGTDAGNLWKIDLQDVGKRPPELLISSTRSQRLPDISPDGTRITFVSDRSGWNEIWVSDFDGSNPVQLTDFHRQTGSPRWSPDGQTIAFDSRERASAIYLVDYHQRLPRRLGTNLPSASVPSWSKDGRWIYCTSDVAAPDRGIYKVPVEGGNAVLVSHTVGFNVQESKDGSPHFASAGLGGEIRVISKGSGEETSLPHMPRVQESPDWVLAENGIYFTDRTGARATLKFLDFATGNVRLLMTLQKPPEIWGGMAISPDRRWLVYSQIDEKLSDIMLAEHYR